MNTAKIRVRFAPSPTGYLHIGGARTALFNYLFARKMGGDFLLRIEDTDKARSTQSAIAAIYDGLEWLGLTPDEPALLQSSRLERHAQIVAQMLEIGAAYNCYMSAEELNSKREEAAANGAIYRYDGTWRDRPASEAPAGVAPSVRLKAPRDGEIIINDCVLGEVRVACSELDDMVLLRADGTPTYLLAVVVDDHDMGITHIIRGDDHFTNSFRQALIYGAMGWDIPQMAHIPLIHGADGKKLSKRHGAMGVDAYRDELGYLPEAMRNYLLRLGWASDDEEIISDEQAINLFSLQGIGKSPARFDFEKLNFINAHYMRIADDERIFALMQPFLQKLLKRELTLHESEILRKLMPELKSRALHLPQLAHDALFLFQAPREYSDKAQKFLHKGADILPKIATAMNDWQDWSSQSLHDYCAEFATANNVKLGEVMNPLRAAITGSHASPSMFEIMPLLGQAECIMRVKNAI